MQGFRSEYNLLACQIQFCIPPHRHPSLSRCTHRHSSLDLPYTGLHQDLTGQIRPRKSALGSSLYGYIVTIAVSQDGVSDAVTMIVLYDKDRRLWRCYDDMTMIVTQDDDNDDVTILCGRDYVRQLATCLLQNSFVILGWSARITMCITIKFG